MATSKKPRLRPGEVLRTEDFRKFTANPSRLVRRLVDRGELRQISRGLYAAPERSKFGEVPPSDEQLVRKLLKGDRFVFTGSDRWNALGLGSTAVLTVPFVYNQRRHGTVKLGNRRFELRQVPRLPLRATAEWYAVDLLENASVAGVAFSTVEQHLGLAVAQRRFDPAALRDMARSFGTKRTQAVVARACKAGACP
jgi:hypothetical protein